MKKRKSKPIQERIRCKISEKQEEIFFSHIPGTNFDPLSTVPFVDFLS